MVYNLDNLVVVVAVVADKHNSQDMSHTVEEVVLEGNLHSCMHLKVEIMNVSWN